MDGEALGKITQIRNLTPCVPSAWFLKWLKLLELQCLPLTLRMAAYTICFAPLSCFACFLSKWSYMTAGRQYLNVLSFVPASLSLNIPGRAVMELVCPEFSPDGLVALHLLGRNYPGELSDPFPVFRASDPVSTIFEQRPLRL